jgi:hypothetical protein
MNITTQATSGPVSLREKKVKADERDSREDIDFSITVTKGGSLGLERKSETPSSSVAAPSSVQAASPAVQVAPSSVLAATPDTPPASSSEQTAPSSVQVAPSSVQVATPDTPPASSSEQAATQVVSCAKEISKSLQEKRVLLEVKENKEPNKLYGYIFSFLLGLSMLR